jgi:regulatory protein
VLFRKDVIRKSDINLLNIAIYGDLLEEIISDLISNNFLDEERFARTFARGKFRMKQWGRNQNKTGIKNKRCFSLFD